MYSYDSSAAIFSNNVKNAKYTSFEITKDLKSSIFPHKVNFHLLQNHNFQKLGSSWCWHWRKNEISFIVIGGMLIPVFFPSRKLGPKFKKRWENKSFNKFRNRVGIFQERFYHSHMENIKSHVDKYSVR